MFLRKLVSNNGIKEDEESKNKCQHKLHLAQINPEPDFDLSNCSIKCLPKGIYGQCRVYRKERLLLNNNNLTSIPDDCDNNLIDLASFLTVLDVSRNQLKSLPSNIGLLSNLKNLYLSQNMLRSIPDSIATMKSLEIINLNHNQLNQFPSALCEIKSLKYIDVSNNQLVTQLPAKICNLTRLEKLNIDETNINHPSRRICDQGIESIFKFFKSNQLVDEMVFEDKFPTDNQSTFPGSPIKEDSLQAYLAKKDDQKRQLIEFEKNLLTESTSIEAMSRRMTDKRNEILVKMKNDQSRLLEEMKSMNVKKIEDKSSLIKALVLAEEHSSKLVKQLNLLNSRTKNIENNSSTSLVTQDEMINALEEKLRNLLTSKDQSKKSLQSELIADDESLYQAICNLNEMKATQSRILSEQITLIENELYHLTKVEIQKRDNNLGLTLIILTEQRKALASMLKDLLNQRDRKTNQRENDSPFLSHLIGKADSSLTEIKDPQDASCERVDKKNYDLIQLLTDLDSSLCKFYLPLFTKSSITVQQLADSTIDQLRLFGIKEEHIPIIRNQISSHLPEMQSNSLPTAPCWDQIVPRPSAPPMKLYQLIECIICLDEQSKIILIPCGHVCTCLNCSQTLESCPLCREIISEKIGQLSKSQINDKT